MSHVVSQIVGMGFAEDVANVAILNSDGTLEGALQWIISKQEVGSDTNFEEDENGNDEYEPLKMVLVVRSDLKMTNGKVSAQCVHAAVSPASF